MSDSRYKHAPRPYSNSPLYKENLKTNTQPHSSFLERVNKIFNTSNKPRLSERTIMLDKENHPSPFLRSKMETLNKTLLSCKARLTEKYTKQRDYKPTEIELFSLKLKNIFSKNKREGFKSIKKQFKLNHKKAETDRMALSQTHENMPAKMMFDSFMKQMSSYQCNLASSVALAKCPRCGNTGMTLLTSSTKDCISPRFMDKIKDLLPVHSVESLSSTQPMNLIKHPKSYTWNEITEKKITNRRNSKAESKFSLQDISAIPINSEDSYDAYHMLSSHNDSDISHKHCRIPKESRYQRHTTSMIPQLDLSDIKISKPNISTNLQISTLESSIPSYKSSLNVLKASPRKTFHDEYFKQGLNIFKDVLYAKMHRVFDLILLSNLNTVRTEEEQSLTFEFSREDIEESRQVEEKLMTGRFHISPRGGEDIVNISSFDSKLNINGIEESFSFDYPQGDSNSWMRKGTINSSAKILYSRMDKIIYRRKVGGFYRLLKELYY